MRRYALPLLVCTAVGAVLVIVFRLGGTDVAPDATEKRADARPAAEGERGPGWRQPRNTRTSLNENEALSELERALARKDLSRAHYFRSKVCEQMDEILQNGTLTKKLLEDIREHGLESDDPRRRDVMLPILRVLAHPDATRMIAEEYFQAKNAKERMVLLDAMAREHHDPETAAVWAVEFALNAEHPDHRYRAFQVIQDHSNMPDVVVAAARGIYEGSVRPEQQAQILEGISLVSYKTDKGKEFLRERLKSPRSEELATIVGFAPRWADERDAAQIEALAMEFPAMAEMLREAAEQVRMARRAYRRGMGEMTDAEVAAEEAARIEREKARDRDG